MFRQEEMSDSKGILAPSRLGCLLRPLRPSPTGPKRFCQEQVQYQLTIGPRLSPAITSCPGRKLNLQSRLPVVSDFYIFPAWGGCRACGRTAGKSEFARSAQNPGLGTSFRELGRLAVCHWENSVDHLTIPSTQYHSVGVSSLFVRFLRFSSSKWAQTAQRTTQMTTAQQ